MVRRSHSVILPCLNTKVIKTQSIKTIESMLRDGLGTIEEEPDNYAPTPSPSPAAAGAGSAALHPKLLQRKISMQKRKVSAKLTKSPRGCWQVKISKFSTVISAPLSSIGDSYVRMMNGLMEKGNLGELAMFDSASSSDFLRYEDKVIHSYFEESMLAD
ncbi:hypothetical protein GOP47_0002433 [Adiantum capillus-veneris]|uniref:Uncharacterized protein n=1 Tax=Adiantum capillus-veneris TaxID=13818 RepID=A0A9D4ZRM2_ADICA|nr:hypothetical protein GOP47_0002433 [Adiantum capillus-veneris]